MQAITNQARNLQDDLCHIYLFGTTCRLLSDRRSDSLCGIGLRNFFPIKKAKTRKTILVFQVFVLSLPRILGTEMVKERILEAARELFREAGVKNTTMDDIAHQASVSKRTIYENFKDKEEVLVACLNRTFVENEQYAAHVFNTSGNVVEAFVLLINRGAEYAYRHRHSILDEIRRYYPDVYKGIVTCNKKEKQETNRRLIEQGMREGVFRNDLDPEILSVMFQLLADGIMLNDTELEKFAIFEIFGTMAILGLRGLCTPKGLEILEYTLSGTLKTTGGFGRNFRKRIIKTSILNSIQ
jgi:AcrR family transcriptional regulator